MFGRESLKTYTSSELYDRATRHFKCGTCYLKYEAGKVMDAMEARIKELESQLPKWISVKDRLPEGNPMLPALTEEGNKIWWGTWHDDNFEIYGITHWLENAFPPPPTTEESSDVEKENG